MMKYLSKRWTALLIVMSFSLLISSNAFGGATQFSGIAVNQSDYDYAPSVMIGDGPLAKMWWCASTAGGDGIFYSTMTASGWSSPQLVMTKSASGWDSKHVCDPSVVKGNFTYNGAAYSYAMYYTGTYDTVGYDSHIGVAFSNNGINWVKNSSNPVISPGGNASTQYGAGMQTAYRVSGTNSNIILAYYDSSLPANNVFMVESTNGINFGARTQLPNPFSYSAIGDIAYSPSENIWYVTTKSMTDLESYTFKTTGSSLTSTWQEWGGRLNSTLTGNEKNHNPGFIRYSNGDIYSEASTGYKYVLFGTGTGAPGSWGIGQAILTDSWEYNVNGNREGWTANNVTTDGGPSSGLWIVTASGSDPHFVSPNLSMLANFKTIQVRMANQNTSTIGKVYFKTATENFYSEDKSVSFTVHNNATWNTYSVNMSGNAKWSGTITGLRVDPIENGSNQSLGIDFIRIAP